LDFLRFSLILYFISVFLTEIFDNIEKENLLMKKKNLELQEQVVILEKSVQTLTEEKKRSKYNIQRNLYISFGFGVGFMVLNATFNNISVISWRSVLLMEKTGENH
jgi:hypothetical protein